MSVTTPADLDRSPISATPTDAQTPDRAVRSSPVKSGDDSVVETSVNVEERTSERTTGIEGSSVECKKDSPSIEKDNKLSVQERTAKESDKPGDGSSPVNNKPPQTDMETPVRQPPPPGGNSSSSAQIRLDFSLSESQGSLSSLDKSHRSLPDLHSSCASAPELRQPPSAAAGNKADLSHSASGANFDWTPAKRADVQGNVYSTPPRTRWEKLRDEDPSKVNGDLSSHARMRRLSGPVDFRRRPPSEHENTRRSSEGGGFADDQISGNTNLYTSFASPKKKTLMMMRNSEAFAQEQKQRLEMERLQASHSDSRTPLPNRTESSEKEPSMNQVAGLQPSEPSVSSRLSPSSSLSSNNAQTLSRTSSQTTSSPNAGSTPPGPPPPTLSPHPHGAVSPAKSSPSSGSPVLGSPSGRLGVSSSPAPGVLPTGPSLTPAVASPPPGTPPVKRKVSFTCKLATQDFLSESIKPHGGKPVWVLSFRLLHTYSRL